MKYLNITKQFASLALVALAFTSCDKVKVTDPVGDQGQTLVKILGGGSPAAIKSNPLDFVPTPATFVGADLRRDLPNNAELNKTMNIVVKDDTAAVRAANPAYVILPASFYTLNVPKTGGSGGTFNVTFKPGEFARQIIVTVPDATLLDPSTKYALAFTITSADGGGVITNSKSIIVEIGAKNIVHENLKWDFFRWNLAALPSALPTIPRSSGWDGDPVTLATIAANANEAPSGYFIQPRYRLTFTNSGGIATNFTLAFNPTDLAALNAAGVTVLNGGPVIEIADFATKHYRFSYVVFNGSAWRYLVDDYHQ